MDESESWLYDTSSDCLDPEIECVVMIIKNSDWWDDGSVVSARGSFYPHIILESCAGFELSLFNFFEYDSITEYYIIDRSINQRRNRKRRSFSIILNPLFPSESIVSESFPEDVRTTIIHDYILSIARSSCVVFSRSSFTIRIS